VITLLLDGLIALVKTIDRGLSAVENVRRQASPRPDADAQPAAGGDFTVSAATGGGHPVWSTSQLLYSAALRLQYLGDDPNGLTPELRDRAADLAAQGD